MTPGTCRHALLVEYDGTDYQGWQRQETGRTVQSCLEQALASLTGQAITVIGAGRTDTGVHARGQVAHCDLDRRWESIRLVRALNAHLRPERIAVLSAASVSRTFHARTSAIERSYRYRLVVSEAPLALDVNRTWRLVGRLQVEPMRVAARDLEGRHDFTTFRSSRCQARSPLRTLDSITIETRQDRRGLHVSLVFTARSFLHRQVRSLVGTLVKVGQGSWPPEQVAAALQACDRTRCGPVAPPAGLTLMQIRYPEDPFGESWQTR